MRVRLALGGYGIDRQVIAKTALLGLGQPLWSFIPPGSKDHLDFAEEYPYQPQKARALLKEAGFDARNPLKYTIMTHSAAPSLPTIATIIKTQLAHIGVEVTIEILDRPIFLKRLSSAEAILRTPCTGTAPSNPLQALCLLCALSALRTSVPASGGNTDESPSPLAR